MAYLLLAILTFFSSGAYAQNQTTVSPRPPEDRPNIIVLFADDMGYGDLSSFGHPYIRTAELDRLAQEGQRWTDFYVAAPVCSPSRAALMTGKLPVRNGLYGRSMRVYFPGEPGGIPQSEITLAEALKQQGYATGIFGKWHLGDAAHALPTNHGFDNWLGVPYSNDMDWSGDPSWEELRLMSIDGETELRSQIVSDRSDKYANPEAEYWNVPLVTSNSAGLLEVEQPTDQALLTRRYTEAAIEFIERNAASPFLVYLPYTMPHTPLFRSSEFSGRSEAGRYGDVIEEIDWSVGEIRRSLERLDIAENSLVIFTSDNGPWLTMNLEGGSAGLLRMGKGSTFEGGMRVPAIFWWPGRIQPGVVNAIGSTLDVFATAVKLAGGNSSSGIDGFDLSPVLFTNADSPRQEMPYYRSGELYAYRVGAWKLHYRHQGAYGQPPALTIYTTPILNNLLRDPAERFDLAAEYPEIVAEIETAVARHRAGLIIQEPLLDGRLQALEQQ